MPDAPYFTAVEFKAEWPDDDQVQALDDAVIDAKRAVAEEIIEGLDTEDGCHRAFVPRTETFTLSGDGTTRLSIPRYHLLTVESIEIGGATVSPDNVSIESSSLYRSIWTRGFGNVVVEVTHGLDAPPLAVKEAAMLLTKHRALKGPIDDRATGIQADGGVITLATPGQRGSVTGIPEVDRVIRAYQLPRIKPVSISVGERGRDYPPMSVL